MRPNPRVQAITGRGMHRRMFPEHIIRTDVEITLTTVKLQILCLQANTGEWIKFVTRPDGRQSVQHHVRMQPATLAERDVGTDNAIRSDFAICANLGPRIDNGCWMDHLPASFYTNPPHRSTLRLVNLLEYNSLLIMFGKKTIRITLLALITGCSFVPLPAITPYDNKPEIRSAYLDGYRIGYRGVVSGTDKGSLPDVASDDPGPHAFVAGWCAGRKAGLTATKLPDSP